jgi:hypothetical protein
VTTPPSHSEEVTVIGRKPVIRNSIEELDKPETWLPGQLDALGYLEN